MEKLNIKPYKKNIDYKVIKIQSTLNETNQKTELLKRKLEKLYDKVNMLSLENYQIKKKLKIIE